MDTPRARASLAGLEAELASGTTNLKGQGWNWLGRLWRRLARAAQVRLVALPVAGLALVAVMEGMGVLPQDPLISFVILLQACPPRCSPTPNSHFPSLSVSH
jgi:hypothetical protein